METYIKPPRQNRISLPLTQPWVTRLIATLGIALMTVALYVAVAGRVVVFQDDPVSRSSETWAIGNAVSAPLAFLHLERMSLLMQLGIQAVHAVITLGGLALIPLLWRPYSRRGIVAMRWTYAIWLVLLTILAVARLPDLRQFMSQPPTGPVSQSYTLEAAYLLPGVVVFPLGVLIGCAALALMLREPLSLSPATPTPRTRWQWAAALMLTVGALTWGIGFYLMPEAVTSACPPIIFSVTQFAHGACAGLDSDQALAAANYADINPIGRLLVNLGWNFELLVALGCITTLGGWTRQLSVYTLAWLAVWPTLAFGVALVALQGVDAVAQRGFKLTAATVPDWRIGPGMVVTFVGLGLVALGQLGLWREMVKQKKPATI